MRSKTFIIGLPRTATTSICCASLNLGFKTAHTAYTQDSFDQAQVIADTPVFSDFAKLDRFYPNSKFIYLSRDLAQWLPSISQLLTRMLTNLQRTDGGFNPYLRRCFSQVFPDLDQQKVADYDYLSQCYFEHQKQVLTYFATDEIKKQQLLTLEIAKGDSFEQFCQFMQVDTSTLSTQILGFEKINMAGKVTAWNQIKHPLKVAATRNGKIDKHLSYLTVE
ncbi:sulfotransferase family protein [Catenovulum sp. SM1970]|uniref:sulfotransferase n=1 Tax=Marinifaba aquimaris TaxID=2741323 RepID=UPI001574B905|nr:sulfotransferase [Marinifaba aquimaris]NTS76636.1 sulfotransferase family protein [Marinifaba aquimaris]